MVRDPEEAERPLAQEPAPRTTGWEEADAAANPPVVERELTIDAFGVPLPARLAVPAAPRGLVLFAHASSSSRRTARNEAVAAVLHRHGLATLLFDLFSAREELEDGVTGQRRLDIPFLARRLIAAADQVRAAGLLRDLPLLFFGAGTGAAAALLADAERPGMVKAIASRGGRPDLVRGALLRVTAPVFLIAGGADTAVLELNRQATGLLPAGSKLAVVPGATHRFPEPGALRRVSVAAARWFAQQLEPRHAATEETAHG